MTTTPHQPQPHTDGTHESIVRFVSRFGGMCRDCADEFGVCPHDGTPCDTDQCRTVIRKTINALLYGIKHKFIPNIFASTNAQSLGGEADNEQL